MAEIITTEELFKNAGQQTISTEELFGKGETLTSEELFKKKPSIPRQIGRVVKHLGKETLNQLGDIATMPSRVLGLPAPPLQSEFATRGLDINVPSLSMSDFKSLLKGKPTYTIQNINPTMLEATLNAGIISSGMLGSIKNAVRFNAGLRKQLSAPIIESILRARSKAIDIPVIKEGVVAPRPTEPTIATTQELMAPTGIMAALKPISPAIVAPPLPQVAKTPIVETPAIPKLPTEIPIVTIPETISTAELFKITPKIAEPQVSPEQTKVLSKALNLLKDSPIAEETFKRLGFSGDEIGSVISKLEKNEILDIDEQQVYDSFSKISVENLQKETETYERAIRKLNADIKRGGTTAPKDIDQSTLERIISMGEKEGLHQAEIELSGKEVTIPFKQLFNEKKITQPQVDNAINQSLAAKRAWLKTVLDKNTDIDIEDIRQMIWVKLWQIKGYRPDAQPLEKWIQKAPDFILKNILLEQSSPDKNRYTNDHIIKYKKIRDAMIEKGVEPNVSAIASEMKISLERAKFIQFMVDTTTESYEVLAEKGFEVGNESGYILNPASLLFKQPISPNIVIEKVPKDLVGFTGMMKSWGLPRHIARMNPLSTQIFWLGRESLLGMNNEIGHYDARIDEAYKGLKPAEQEQLADYLEGKLPLETMPTKFQKAYKDLDALRDDFYQLIEEDLKKDVSKWSIPRDQYLPHIFVGSYQITVSGKTIDGGFARSLGEALGKAEDYLKEHPDANISIGPREFSDEYTATLLSRKGFGRFINEVRKATELNRDEVVGLMKGVAAIKPRPKFVGNFMQRSVNLGGYEKGPLAFKIYASRIVRKKYLDPFRKQATDLALQLPQGLREYFLTYIDDVSGKYNPFDKNFSVSRTMGKLTRFQSIFKLGYRPITALVNRFQPMQTAFSEIGGYLFRGAKFKHSQEGKELIRKSGILGEVPKYAMGEYKQQNPEFYKPLYMFYRAEVANREDVLCGGYLFAKSVFNMPRAKAIKLGYQYILDYMDTFKTPEGSANAYAKDLDNDCNYIYNNSDFPKAFRMPILRPALQFKAYPINYTIQSLKWLVETVTNPSPHNTARATRFIAANITLGGLRSIPYIGRTLWKWWMFSPLLLALLPKKTRETVGRGVFSLIGVDLSRRFGPNEFLPTNFAGLGGVFINDLYALYKYFHGDYTLEEALTSPISSIRDVYRALKDPNIMENKRDRILMEASGADKLLQMIGAPLTKVEVARDMSFIWRQKAEEFKTQKAQLIDKMLERIAKDAEIEDLVQRAEKEGIRITRDDLKAEQKKKQMGLYERVKTTLPKNLREQYEAERNLLTK